VSGRQADYVAYVEGRLAWLRRLAYLLCQDWHYADDLVQATLTRLFTCWPRAARMDNLSAAAVLVSSPRSGRQQQVCIPDWHGLQVEVILNARDNAPAPNPAGPHGVLAYARMLHPLGPDPAHWTADPLR